MPKKKSCISSGSCQAKPDLGTRSFTEHRDLDCPESLYDLHVRHSTKLSDMLIGVMRMLKEAAQALAQEHQRQSRACGDCESHHNGAAAVSGDWPFAPSAFHGYTSETATPSDASTLDSGIEMPETDDRVGFAGDAYFLREIGCSDQGIGVTSSEARKIQLEEEWACWPVLEVDELLRFPG